MKFSSTVHCCLATLGLGLLGLAAPGAVAQSVSQSAGDCDAEPLEAVLASLGATEYRITGREVGGLCEVAFGISVAYLTSDGQHLVHGQIMETATRRNLTDSRATELRAEVLAEAPDLALLSYPANAPKYEVTVVTDVDCPYCRRLHATLDEFNAAGISVRYLLAPLRGAGSPSYLKAVQAMCDAAPESAMTRLMNGEAIDTETACEHDLDAQLKLARAIGASSTPSFVLPDGRLVPGLMDTERVLGLLNSAAAPVASR